MPGSEAYEDEERRRHRLRLQRHRPVYGRPGLPHSTRYRPNKFSPGEWQLAATLRSKETMIRSWLSTCNSEHGSHCQTNHLASVSTAGRPLWLIDVRSHCLTPAHPSHQYAALSYVRDVVRTLQATTKNIDLLQGVESLAHADIAHTILDAIDLAGKFHVRYIWVDSLCILQDNEHEKASQIRGMASI